MLKESNYCEFCKKELETLEITFFLSQIDPDNNDEVLTSRICEDCYNKDYSGLTHAKCTIQPKRLSEKTSEVSEDAIV